MPEEPVDGPGGEALRAGIEALRAPVAPNRGVERALDILRERQRGQRLPWLAAAAVLVAAAGITGIFTRRPTRAVRFTVRSPEAHRVALVGDFNDWNRAAVNLERHGSEWSVTLRLRPGRYRYSFLADGTRWIGDARGAAREDDFDTPTQVVTVAN